MNILNLPLSKQEITAGFIFLAVQQLFLQPAILLVNTLLRNPLSEPELNFIYFALNFLCITVIFRKFLINNAKVAIVTPFRCLQSAGIGFLLQWVCNYIVSFVIFFLLPDFYNVNDNSVQQLVTDNIALMTVALVILVPVVEETLYRGLIFRLLYGKNRFLAYAISTIAFSALHVIGYIGLYEPLHLFICFLQYIPASLCLAWTYARSGSIWSSILLHAAANQVAILSMR